MALTDLFNTYDILYTPTDYSIPDLDIYDFPDFYTESVKPKSKEMKEESVPQWFTEDIIVSNMKPSAQSSTSSTGRSIKFKNNDEYISTMLPLYQKEVEARGGNPELAYLALAQNALESGWGKHTSGKNNFGGIKGKGTTRQTKEWDGTKYITINSQFKDFDTPKDFVKYHLDLLGNNRYNIFSSENINDSINKIVKGGYATDPNYGRKLRVTYNSLKKKYS